MLRTTSILLLALLCSASCGGTTAPVGYSGPIASVEARNLLGELRGLTFDDAAGELGGGTFTVGPFGVIPNPRTGKGPVVQLEGPRGEVWLPMEADGDVADLWTRVHGSAPDGVAGSTSDAYRSVWVPSDG